MYLSYPFCGARIVLGNRFVLKCQILVIAIKYRYTFKHIMPLKVFVPKSSNFCQNNGNCFTCFIVDWWSFITKVWSQLKNVSFIVKVIFFLSFDEHQHVCYSRCHFKRKTQDDVAKYSIGIFIKLKLKRMSLPLNNRSILLIRQFYG